MIHARIDADDRQAAEQIGALFEPERDTRPAESLEIGPDILAHPAVQAEIARQVALGIEGIANTCRYH
jgi:hypothetical protein